MTFYLTAKRKVQLCRVGVPSIVMPPWGPYCRTDGPWHGYDTATFSVCLK